MRFCSVYRLVVVGCLLAICSCTKTDNDTVESLKAELVAAKADAAAAKAELAKIKESGRVSADTTRASGRYICDLEVTDFEGSSYASHAG